MPEIVLRTPYKGVQILLETTAAVPDDHILKPHEFSGKFREVNVVLIQDGVPCIPHNQREILHTYIERSQHLARLWVAYLQGPLPFLSNQTMRDLNVFLLIEGHAIQHKLL